MIMEVVVRTYVQYSFLEAVNEISFSFFSRVHIWSTYSTEIHLAANEIIFVKFASLCM